MSERMSKPSAAADLPSPDPAFVLIRVMVVAFLATAHEKPKRRARAFLDVASRTMADEESMALLFPIRPRSDHAAVVKARRQALAMYRQFLPTFVAALPPESI